VDNREEGAHLGDHPYAILVVAVVVELHYQEMNSKLEVQDKEVADTQADSLVVASLVRNSMGQTIFQYKLKSGVLRIL
jgi:hypothetical protein